MCKWGTDELVRIGGKPVFIDKCIAPIVMVLNKGGLKTIAACCGHGKRPGNIVLEDGRELFIMPDFDLAREFDRIWNKACSGKE